VYAPQCVKRCKEKKLQWPMGVWTIYLVLARHQAIVRLILPIGWRKGYFLVSEAGFSQGPEL
jgi:hypothetical protein